MISLKSILNIKTNYVYIRFPKNLLPNEHYWSAHVNDLYRAFTTNIKKILQEHFKSMIREARWTKNSEKKHEISTEVMGDVFWEKIFRAWTEHLHCIKHDAKEYYRALLVCNRLKDFPQQRGPLQDSSCSGSSGGTFGQPSWNGCSCINEKMNIANEFQWFHSLQNFSRRSGLN